MMGDLPTKWILIAFFYEFRGNLLFKIIHFFTIGKANMATKVLCAMECALRVDFVTFFILKAWHTLVICKMCPRVGHIL